MTQEFHDINKFWQKFRILLAWKLIFPYSFRLKMKFPPRGKTAEWLQTPYQLPGR